jgi:uncharacterized protein DUF4326
VACHGDVYVEIAGAARVVHCMKEPYDVYIGRPSKWGNPFNQKGRVGLTKIRVIMKFREWFLGQPQLVEDAKRELHGKVLGCWCVR